MKLLLPILAMACTVLATLMALVFCMVVIALLGVARVVVGILLIRAGQPGWASVAAFAPTVIFGIILLIALLRS